LRHRLAAVVVLLGILGGAATACSNDGGSEDRFCAQLPETPDLADVVRDLDSAAPEQLDDRLSNAADSYGDLRDAAPDEVRDDVDRVTDTVERILRVVREHIDDRDALRTELASRKADLLGVGPSAQRVVDYARDTCGIDLGS
jgi:hypothetical protein